MGKVTVEMDEAFLKWWNTTMMVNDKTKMLIAWWGWEACRDYYTEYVNREYQKKVEEVKQT